MNPNIFSKANERSSGTGRLQSVRRSIALTVMGVVICGLATDAAAVTSAGVLFLRIAAGARAAGMGEAFVAVASDATATHWNPAGLGEYPLNSSWKNVHFPEETTVRRLALVRNNLPGRGHQGYDAWMLTDRGLMRYADDRWDTHTELTPRSGQTLLDALRRQMPTATDEHLRQTATTVAEFNQPLSLAELEEVIAAIETVIPGDYKDRDKVDGFLEELRDGYLGCALDLDRLQELRTVVNEVSAREQITSKDHDRIRFLLGRTVAYHPVGTVRLPIGLAVGGEITDIAGDGRRLFVISTEGLFVYDGRNWEAVPAPTDAGWEAETVNCIAVTTGPRIWLGTNDGVKVRAGATWKSYGTAAGLPSAVVTHIACKDTRNGWAMTAAGLARFRDTTFTATFSHGVAIGETSEHILGNYLNTEDAARIARAVDAVAAHSDGVDLANLQTGDVINIPYALGIVGDVRTLAYDGYGRIWVGTQFGAARLWRGSWRAFGYRPFQTVDATTTTAVARGVLGDRADASRVERLADHIRRYNRLDGESIDPGRVVYVYRNPAGSPVDAILGEGDDVFFATNAGVLRQHSGVWGRYYHGGLERANALALGEADGDIWFVTKDRMVIYSRPHKEISLMFSPWLPDLAPDLYYGYAAYTTNVEGWGTIGANVTILSFGEILRTNEFGEAGESFHSFDMAGSVSYGTKLGPNLAAGLTAKVIYSRLSPQGAGIERGSGDATAFAVDAGLLYRTPLSRLSLGAALTNLGPNISYIDADQSDPLPRNLAVGFAYRLADSPYNRLMIVGEINKELVDLTEGGSEEFSQIIYNGGLEYVYSNIIAIRGGYVHDSDGELRYLTVGAGLSIKAGFDIDVAYIPSFNEVPLANTLRYSLRIQF